MTLTYRSVKGTNLTADEVDENFSHLDDRIDTAVASIADPNGIANIVQNGSTFVVVLDDSTELGPFTLPVATPRPTTTLAVSGATLTPGLSQGSYYFRCTNAGGCVVTIPDFADVAIPTDTEFHFYQAAAGAISFVEGSTDVVVNVPAGFEYYTDGQGSVVTAKKVAENEWDLFGRLAEEVSA